jgi:hypothetical protein
MRNARVKWQSLYNESRWFSGVVRCVIDDRALVDDDSGRSFRVIPTTRLIVIDDMTRVVLRK